MQEIALIPLRRNSIENTTKICCKKLKMNAQPQILQKKQGNGEKSPDLKPEISWSDWKSLRTMCCDSWMIPLFPSQTTRLKTICAWSKCNRRCRDVSDQWMAPKYSAAYAVTSRPAENKALLRLMLCAFYSRESGLSSWQAPPQICMLNSYA